MNTNKAKTLTQILRFLVVGGTAFLIDFFVLYLLTELAGINYLLSNGISFTLSTVYNYFLSTLWVFDTKTHKRTLVEMLVFFVLSAAGLGINQGIMWIAVEKANINYLISKILATIIVMIFNFVTRKRFLEN